MHFLIWVEKQALYNNNGTLLNGMSSQNATYVYAKEIRNGASKVALSNEEKLTLEKCINK